VSLSRLAISSSFILFFIGSVRVNSDPLPSVLLTEIEPPSRFTYFLAIANPNPVPSNFLEVLLSAW